MSFDLALNSGDLSIQGGKFALVHGDNETVQRVIVRLKWLLGEWFLNTDEGLPWYDSILGKKDTNYASLLIRRQILNTDDVTGIKKLNLSFDNRSLSIYALVSIGGTETPLTVEVPIV